MIWKMNGNGEIMDNFNIQSIYNTVFCELSGIP
jgi:hypothetical protein